MLEGVRNVSEKRKISVKINGRNQTFKEVSHANERTEDEHSLGEIHKQLENVIDFKKKKQERKHYRQPFWDDGNHDNIPNLPFYKRKKKRLFGEISKLPLTVMIASISAIIIGLGLGFMLLTIFTGDNKESIASVQPQGEVEAKEVIAAVGEEISVYFIQVGAFSDLAKGKEMANIIGQKGFKAILKEDANPKLLFAGIALERGQAEKLQEMIQLAGFETFIKTEQVAITGDEIGGVYRRLLQLTELGLIEGRIDADEIASIQLKMSELELGEGKVEKVLNETIQSLQDYLKNKDKQTLWQAQGSLIEVAFALN